jgi:predicted helicase
MPLLPHQQNAINKSVAAYKGGQTRQYLVHAMSLGKTYGRRRFGFDHQDRCRES